MDLAVAVRKATLSQSGSRSADTTKIQYLMESSGLLDQIRIFIQLAYDLKTLPISAYSELSDLTGNLGKQIGAMLKYEMKKKAGDHPS